jgi:hypothetical protein
MTEPPMKTSPMRPPALDVAGVAGGAASQIAADPHIAHVAGADDLAGMRAKISTDQRTSDGDVAERAAAGDAADSSPPVPMISLPILTGPIAPPLVMSQL